jgi:hypothetical protein
MDRYTSVQIGPGTNQRYDDSIKNDLNARLINLRDLMRSAESRDFGEANVEGTRP